LNCFLFDERLRDLAHAYCCHVCFGSVVAAAPADPYLEELFQIFEDKRISPSDFAKVWPDFQDQQLPLFDCLRPASAKVRSLSISTTRYANHNHPAVWLMPVQGTPAALTHDVFGLFLDDARTVCLDHCTCQAVMDLIRDMSNSYMNTNTKAAREISQKIFGPSYAGKARGQEAARAECFRCHLLGLIQALLPDLAQPSTLEPSSVSQVCVPGRRFVIWCTSLCLATCMLDQPSNVVTLRLGLCPYQLSTVQLFLWGAVRVEKVQIPRTVTLSQSNAVPHSPTHSFLHLLCADGMKCVMYQYACVSSSAESNDTNVTMCMHDSLLRLKLTAACV
jgi:hypothetical protein